MSIRKAGLALFALLAVCASLVIVPLTAGAKTAPRATTTKTEKVKSLSSIPVSGTATNGKSFSGHFNVTRFIHHGKKTFAVGKLTGSINGQRVNRAVTLPVSVDTGTAGTRQAASCPVLHLVLGPLDLNLLGLHVHLNQVVLDITAVPGAGNLLGNLVCDVANLLNQSPTAGQLTGLLNTLNTLLGQIVAGLGL
jgi:hypothetical protein